MSQTDDVNADSDELLDENEEDSYQLHREIRVDPGQNPLRIDKFLFDRLEMISRNRIQNAIKSGAVTVDGEEIKPNFKIKPNHVISMVVPKPPGEGIRVLPQNIPLDVVYEDEDVLVINKPAGLVTHPGVGHYRGTLVNAIAYHFGFGMPVLNGNNQDKLGLVHRIDKNTSGLLVIAKSEYAMSHLAKQFFQHTVERTYYALVWGDLRQDKGTIIANVGRDPKDRKRFTVFPEKDQGKWAVTHYEVIERFYYTTLIKCNLETGRTHQIRVHMRYIGHPLFSDDKYDGARIAAGTVFSKYKQFVDHCFSLMPRHALHAKSLGFVHPATGEHTQFDSELPADFQSVLMAWRNYIESRKMAVVQNPNLRD